jgi:hypothetical protein
MTVLLSTVSPTTWRGNIQDGVWRALPRVSQASANTTPRPESSHLRQAGVRCCSAGWGGAGGGCGGWRSSGGNGCWGGGSGWGGSGWGGCTTAWRCAFGAGRRGGVAAPKIGDIPARALELETGSGELFAKAGLSAGWANAQRVVGHFLQHVLGMAAGLALVGIDGHGVNL